MLEIEAKAKIDDPEELKKRVLAFGGKHERDEIHQDIYFAHPCRDFAKTDEAVRVRTARDEHFLTYKGPKLDGLTKTREEFEVKIDDPAQMVESLERLGFKKVMEVAKKRALYTLRDYKITIDYLEELGHFMEIEKHADSYEPKELIEQLKKLGIDESQVERKSYLELLMEKKGG